MKNSAAHRSVEGEKKKTFLPKTTMAESWDSSTRSTVQKLPLLTVREIREGQRDQKGRRKRERSAERASERERKRMPLSTPAHENENTKKLFHPPRNHNDRSAPALGTPRRNGRSG